MNSVTEFIKTLGPARLAAMGAVAIGLIGFFIFLMLRFSNPQMEVLFTDLSLEDSAEIVNRLEGMNVPHEIRQDGAVILVPAERVLRMRMTMAEDGLPSGGTVGYEIFDNTDTLGSTSFVQKINRLRAIEGELARTIQAISRVKSARVHLVLPERRLFAQEAADPSASIVLKVRGSLDSGQIKAVQHMVASAVEGLEPGSVSIVDESGQLLADGRGGESNMLSATADERKRAIEERTRQEIEDIVTSVVGAGRARVRVTAEMDYNRIVETSDQYDPDGQVVRSTQLREESSAITEPTTDDSVSVGNELPAANAQEEDGDERESATTSEEVINYEISKTTRKRVVEGGRLKRLSVAVLVDGMYEETGDGALQYAPRSEEQLEKIATLVRSAVGFDEERGDQVEVVNMRFADTNLPQPAEPESGMLDFSKNDYFHIAELAVVALISLLVLLFVIRPLVRRIITPEIDRSDEKLAIEWNPESGGQLPAPEENEQEDNVETALLNSPNSAASEALKNAKIIGEIQANAIRDVGEIVENNNEAAVSIVRNWIQEREV